MALETVNMVLIDNKQAVPKEFNKIATRYDFATGMSQGYQSDLNRSAKYLSLKGDEKVLDLCCGTGRSVKAILPLLNNGTIVGVDNSEEMLEVAKRKFASEVTSGKVSFSLQDAMHMDFEPNTFDAIFVAYGLRNMPDYEKFTEGLYRILKPGGKLVLHDYSLAKNWFSKPFWTFISVFFMIPIGFLSTGTARIFIYLYKSVMRFLNPKQVVDLLNSKGFQDVQSIPQPFWRAPILRIFTGVKPL